MLFQGQNFCTGYENCLEAEAEHMKSIHFNSLFNKRIYFHVTDGTPLCLGHDLFEGLVQRDAPLILRELERIDGRLTIDMINRIMSCYPFRGSDARDRPGIIQKNCKRLSGNAVQNWTFIRFLPLISADKIQNFKSDA